MPRLLACCELEAAPVSLPAGVEVGSVSGRLEVDVEDEVVVDVEDEVVDVVVVGLSASADGDVEAFGGAVDDC